MALDSALGLLSALISLPMAFYYARLFGAAAVRPVRDQNGRLTGLICDARWTRVLIAFLAGTVLVAGATAIVQAAAGPVVSGHAAFGAMTVVLLWRPAGEHLVRALLVLLLIAAGAARTLIGGESAAGVLAGYTLGLACACAVWAAMRLYRRKHAW
jgi:hypothetical protein